MRYCYLIASICVFLSCVEKENRKPNVLFIFADDQRSDALGASGNPYIQTPTLDQLAKEGSRFTNAYVMGGNHGAICMASRAMVLSGKSLFHVYDKLKDITTLPMHFGREGYLTFGTGKWHNEKEAFEASFKKGKNVFLGGMADHFAVSVRDLSNDGTLTEPVKRGFSTELFTSAVMDFITDYAASDQEAPFFTYLAYTSPHDPYTPARDYVDFYAKGSLPLPGNFMGTHPFAFDNMTVRDENLTGWPRKPEVIQAILADYYGLITHMDRQIGAVVELLKKNDLYENTIIIYAADNGLAIGSHGLLGKQNLYEHSTKVPLIIKGPGIPQDKELDALVYLHDLFPTLTELAGLPTPEGIDGKSLVNLIQGRVEEIRSSLFTAYRHTVRAVRDSEWKLIRYPERDFSQLFDLKRDPLELNNLAALPGYATKMDSLTNLLKEWQVLSGDTARLTIENPLPLSYDPATLVRQPDQWQPAYTLEKYFVE